MSTHSAETIARRFWAKVKRGSPDECWPWTGYRKPSGHGLTQHKYISILASRKAWILTHGDEMLEGLCVNHRCDNVLCCNPAHMYLGTRIDNMIDRWGKIPGDQRRRYGRNRVMTDETLASLFKDADKGTYTLVKLAKKYRVHYATIRRRLKERQAVRESKTRI